MDCTLPGCRYLFPLDADVRVSVFYLWSFCREQSDHNLRSPPLSDACDPHPCVALCLPFPGSALSIPIVNVAIHSPPVSAADVVNHILAPSWLIDQIAQETSKLQVLDVSAAVRVPTMSMKWDILDS